MPITAETLTHYLNPILIETGTFRCGGTTAALEAGFKQVHTVEIYPALYHNAVEIFADKPHVTPYLGSSVERLPEILNGINEPVTFFLDAHYCGGATGGAWACPLMGELELIAQHHIKSHTVLIDDLHLCNLDIPSIEHILESLRVINPKYTYALLPSAEPHLEWDILAASVTHDHIGMLLLTTGPYVAPGAGITDPNITVCAEAGHAVHGRHHHCSRCDKPSSYQGHLVRDQWQCH